jgi:hypothetical protein
MNEIFCLTYNKKSAIIIIAIAINVSKNIKRLGADLVFFFANHQNILQKCYNTIKLKLQ